MVPAAVLGCLLWTGGGARASSMLSGGIGIGYLQPLATEISRPYGGGLSFHVMADARIPSSRVRLAVEAGLRQSSTTLAHPDFVASAQARLRSYPVDLLAELPIVRQGPIRPYAGFGIEMLWLKERFEYSIAPGASERSPSARFGLGPMLAAGIDRAAFPLIRIEAFATYVPISRAVSGGSGTYDAGGVRIDAGSVGARIFWRYP